MTAGVPMRVRRVIAVSYGMQDAIMEYVARQVGEPERLSLHEVIRCEPSIAIHVVRMADRIALVTRGMSDRAMTVPEGGEAYQFAELVMYLPTTWPLGDRMLADDTAFWPVAWLRRMALYPHEHRTWLGGPFTIVSNDDPPRPLASNTRMTCLLAVAAVPPLQRVALADGRDVVFYTVIPVYTEERDVEIAQGLDSLLRRFDHARVGVVVDVNRPNTAVQAQ